MGGLLGVLGGEYFGGHGGGGDVEGRGLFGGRGMNRGRQEQVFRMEFVEVAGVAGGGGSEQPGSEGEGLSAGVARCCGGRCRCGESHGVGCGEDIAGFG